MSRKQKALAQEEALRKQREAAMLPKEPPRLPSHSPLPQIASFGGDHRPDSVAIVSNKAGNYSQNFSRPSVEQHRMAPTTNLAVLPPVPGSSHSYMDTDPYARTESMTNRGRYSYASSQISTVNSPRRVRKKKQPTPFKCVYWFHVLEFRLTFVQHPRTWYQRLWQVIVHRVPSHCACAACQEAPAHPVTAAQRSRRRLTFHLAVFGDRSGWRESWCHTLGL